jgi:hypothetical protein
MMNSWFDELNSRFADQDRAAADRDAVVDSRLAALEANQSAATAVAATTAAALEQRLAGLESVHVEPLVASVEQRLTSLEANYADRDAEYSDRFHELEALRVAHMTDESDLRVAALEKETAELKAWRPGVEGFMDDVKLQVQKLNSKSDCMVFNAMPPSAGPSLPSPSARTVAGAAPASPHGHRAASTPRDVASGVVTT